jgi:hypothetical protein
VTLDAHQFVFKCLLEGVQVPFTQAQVASSPNSPARADVEFAPTSAIRNLLPNTICHILWYDELEKDLWYQAFLFYFTGKGAAALRFGNNAEVDATGAVSSALNPQKLFNLQSSVTQSYSTLLSANVEQTFRDLLEKVKGFNDFFASMNQRLKIDGRIRVFPDAELQDLIRARGSFERIFDVKAMPTHSGYSPVIDLLQTLCGYIYYDWVDICPAGPKGQLLFKPANYLCVPPMCNVFYPARYQLVDERRNYRAEPTRLIARVFPKRVSTGITAQTPMPLYFAPREIQDAVDELRSAGAKDKEVEQRLNDLNGFILTKEEKLKGIIPRIINLSNSEWGLRRTSSSQAQLGSQQDRIKAALAAASEVEGVEDVDGNKKYLRNLLDYKFSIVRFEGRKLTLSHSFNPFVAAGFPGLALDAFSTVYGYVVSASHVVTPRAGSTAITMTHTRRVGEEFGFPPLPEWINESYVTGGVYPAILGSAPLFEGTRDGDGKLFEAEAAKLLALSKNAADPREFAYNAIRRPFVTEKDHLAFLGAQGAPSEDGNVLVYSGGPFSAEAQAPVREHVDILARFDALDGA